MSEWTVALTRDEVICLTDRVANTDRGTEDMALSSYPLLLKLGGLYLELVQPDGSNSTREVAVTLSEAEIWLLRSKVTSGERSASDAMLGVKLLRKLYGALLAIDAESSMPQILVTTEDGLRFSSSQIQRWKQYETDRDTLEGGGGDIPLAV